MSNTGSPAAPPEDAKPTAAKVQLKVKFGSAFTVIRCSPLGAPRGGRLLQLLQTALKRRKLMPEACVADDDDFMEFKIKNTTKFQKVFEALASQRGVAIGTFSLDFDGQRINGSDTPADLDMDEEASVDFRVEQVGGAASSL